jgi:glycosyltransferase involved in cell wall biosynthesis
MNDREFLTAAYDLRGLQTVSGMPVDATGRPMDYCDLWERYLSELSVKRRDDALRVWVFIGEPGVSPWRVWPWCMELAKDPRFDIKVSMNAYATPEGHLIGWPEVLFFQRCTNEWSFKIAEAYKATGRPVIYDNDDWLDGVPRYNPASDTLDKLKFNEGASRFTALADVCSFSTPHLAGLYSGLAKRAVVLPNSFRPDDWQMPDPSPWGERRGTVNVGWAGSPTHWEDLHVLERPLAKAMEKHTNMWFVRLGVYGQDLHRDKDGAWEDKDPVGALPQDRTIKIAFEKQTHLMSKLWGALDVGLVPLVFNNFNRAKSDVGLLAHAAAGVPVIATDIEPYRPHADHAMLIRDNDEQEWFEAIDRLVSDETERKRLGKAGRDAVWASYTIEANAHKWADLLVELGTAYRARKAGNDNQPQETTCTRSHESEAA